MTKPAASISLGFGWQYAAIAAAGFTGTIPLAAWTVTLGSALSSGSDAGARGGAAETLGAIAGGVAAVLLLVLPSLAPCLTLRARQPRGARVAWDDDEVVEWDGPWKRAVMPWSRAVVAHLKWEVALKGGSRTYHAVQIVDRSSDAAITIWETAPKGAPVVRRRLCAPDLKALLSAIESRKVDSSGTFEASRAVDRDRPRRAWILALGRLGYPLAVFAPLGSPDSRWPGYVAGAVATVLLAIRAVPVFHELRAIARHLAGASASGGALAAERAEDPYRVAAPAAVDDRGRAAALRLRLRAVAFEALVRATFVGLTVASTIAGAIVMHR